MVRLRTLEVDNIGPDPMMPMKIESVKKTPWITETLESKALIPCENQIEKRMGGE